MSSSLFRTSPATAQQPQNLQGNDLHSAVRNMRGMLKGQDKRKVLTQLCMKNPNVKAFVQQAQGKSINQVAAECGIDIDFLRSIK